MNFSYLLKAARLVLLLLLLGAIMVTPALAQDPDDEESDVSIQQVDFTSFLWNPSAIAMRQNDGIGITKLHIVGAQQVYALNLVLEYDNTRLATVQASDITPGPLLQGTQGVDYFMQVMPPTSLFAPVCGGNARVNISVTYLPGSPVGPISGTGTLFEIAWRAGTLIGAAPACLVPSPFSQVIDNGGTLSLTPVPLTPLGILIGVSGGLSILQIGLEGGEWAHDQISNPTHIAEVFVNSVLTCPPYLLGSHCQFPTPATPFTVEVKRPGYIDAKGTFNNPSDLSSVTLLAGDTDGDNDVDIFDLTAIATKLGQNFSALLPCPYPPPPPNFAVPNNLEIMDYTGPGFPPTPDCIINILDLVLVAKNFGNAGVTPIPGSVPF